MDEVELKRERRKQRALERLGSNNPRCVVCGFDDPLALELHHIAGRSFDEEAVPVCRNCHRRLSDHQKDHSLAQAKAGSELAPSRVFWTALPTFSKCSSSAFANSRRNSPSSTTTRKRMKRRRCHERSHHRSPEDLGSRLCAAASGAGRQQTCSQKSDEDYASFRMDARLRHRNDGRRGAAAQGRRLSIPKRR